MAIMIPSTSKNIFSPFFNLLFFLMIKGMTSINRHSYILAGRIYIIYV